MSTPWPWLHKYCRKGIGDKTGTFKITQEIRRNVSFMEANLQRPQTNLGPFDIIFLRNVIIYFDVTIKKRVLANVIDRLKPDGIIMVGHSESLNGISERVQLLRPSIYRLTDQR